MAKQRALVTGANRGIGAAVAEGLAQQGFEVLVGARRMDSAAPVLESIHAAGGVAEAVELDVGSSQAVLRAAERLGALDVLVNNAGVAHDGFDHEVVLKTLAVNFEGARQLTEACWAKLRSGARVINVSSGLADEAGMPKKLRSRFEACAQPSQVVELMDDFAALVADGAHRGAGWPSSAYRVSKLGLNALTRVWDRRARGEGRGIVVTSMCPGWVRTDMGGSGAPRSVQQGADTVIWLAAEAGPESGGGYFRDRAPAAW